MFRNMATSLLEHGRIQTTDARAKELRGVVERLITLGKRVSPEALENAKGDEFVALRAKRVHAVRQARLWVRDRGVLQVLFSEYSERYQDRPGGYTRITKIGRRNGDNAAMSLIELVVEPMGSESSSSAPVVEDAVDATDPDAEPDAATDDDAADDADTSDE
jgi:large subunit ribosomal protein L17